VALETLHTPLVPLLIAHAAAAGAEGAHQRRHQVLCVGVDVLAAVCHGPHQRLLCSVLAIGALATLIVARVVISDLGRVDLANDGVLELESFIAAENEQKEAPNDTRKATDYTEDEVKRVDYPLLIDSFATLVPPDVQARPIEVFVANLDGFLSLVVSESLAEVENGDGGGVEPPEVKQRHFIPFDVLNDGLSALISQINQLLVARDRSLVALLAK